MQRTIKWGIIGLGKIAQKFAEDLALTPNATLYAVASRFEEKAISFGSRFGVSRCYADYESLAKDETVDAVYIATPHVLHHENTLLCLQHKKAVLCEKPFAMNAEQANEMLVTAQANEVFLMEALWTQFVPSFQKLQQLIRSDAIGRIRSIRADFGFKAPFDAQSRLFDKQLGGGALLDVGIYPVFLAHSLLGFPDKIEASAQIGETGVDEHEIITFHYPGGVYASLEASLTVNTPVEAHIIGETGWLTLHSRWHEPTSLTLYTDRHTSQTFTFPKKGNGYYYEIEEVCNALQSGATESTIRPHEATLSLMQLLDAIRKQLNLVY